MIVLHLQEGDFRFASRVLKEAMWSMRAAISDHVVLLGTESASLPREEILGEGIRIVRSVPYPRGRLRGPIPAALRMVMRWCRMIASGLRERYDLVHCHSVPALPASVVLAKMRGVPLVYDAHELESQAGQKPRLASFVALVERVLIRLADGVICVSEGIADWYVNEYGIRRPTVVRNVPDRNTQVRTATSSLRDVCGAASGDLLFLYQGALSPGRRIEQLIRVFSGLPHQYRLVFLGYGVLQDTIKAHSDALPNVHFVPAVPPSEVLALTATADVGLCGVENVCLSYYLSLPNKLFEFLMAGVPVLAPAYPEIARVLAPSGAGWLVGEADGDWANAIRAITVEDLNAKKRAAAQAGSALSWSAEAEKMGALYTELRGRANRRRP